MQGRKLLQAPCIVAESRHLQFGNELFIKPKQQQTPAAVAYWTQWYDSVPQCSIHQIVADYSMSCTKETSADCSLARGSLAKQQTKSWRKKKSHRCDSCAVLGWRLVRGCPKSPDVDSSLPTNHNEDKAGLKMEGRAIGYLNDRARRCELSFVFMKR